MERWRHDVTVTWGDGIQGPVVCFQYNTGGGNDLRVGERVSLTHSNIPPRGLFAPLEDPTRDAARRDILTTRGVDSDAAIGQVEGEPTSWLAKGAVVRAHQSTGVVEVALYTCTAGLLGVDYEQSLGFPLALQL